MSNDPEESHHCHIRFDGGRRLAQKDLLLSTDCEVRLKLSEGTAYVTDLVVQTMKRAECFLNATEDEKGRWTSDNLTEVRSWK